VLLIFSQLDKSLGLEPGEGMLPLLPLLLLQLVLHPLVVLVQWVLLSLLLDMLLLNQQDHLLLLRVFTPDLRLALALDLTLMVVALLIYRRLKQLPKQPNKPPRPLLL